MGKIRIRTREATPSIGADDGKQGFPDDVRSQMTDDALTGSARVYHAGGDDEPQLFEVSMPPNIVVPPHAHEADEIIYVVEGSIVLGSRVLGADGSVFVPGETLYSFRSGPEGVRYINFRPRRDASYITKRDFMERRGEAEGASAVSR